MVLGARTTAVPVVLLLVGAKTDAGEGTISAVEWMGLDRVRCRPSPPMKLPLLLLLLLHGPGEKKRLATNETSYQSVVSAIKYPFFFFFGDAAGIGLRLSLARRRFFFFFFFFFTVG